MLLIAFPCQIIGVLEKLLRNSEEGCRCGPVPESPGVDGRAFHQRLIYSGYAETYKLLAVECGLDSRQTEMRNLSLVGYYEYMAEFQVYLCEAGEVRKPIEGPRRDVLKGFSKIGDFIKKLIVQDAARMPRHQPVSGVESRPHGLNP